MCINKENYAFSNTIKEFGKFVKKVLSGHNEDRKKLLKLNLQDFLNLCESFDISNQNDTNMSIDNLEIKVIHIEHETNVTEASKEGNCEGKVCKRPLAKKRRIDSDVKKVKLDRKVDLPDEIWMKIMGYVKSFDLFQNVSLVCKHFYNIHRDAVKYVAMKSVDNKKNHQNAINTLLQCKSLKMFEIDVVVRKYSNPNNVMSQVDDIIKQVLVTCAGLKSLKINMATKILWPDPKAKRYPTMENIGTLGKRLEHLEMIGEQIYEKSFISNLSKLKILKIDRVLYFDLYEFEILVRQHLPQLEAISIGEQLKLDFGNVDEIITKICQNCPKLKIIHLKGDRLARIQDQTIIKLFKDFNVTITLHHSKCKGSTKSWWGPQCVFICRQSAYETYMKEQDLQLYENYMKMNQQRRWLYLLPLMNIVKNHTS